MKALAAPARNGHAVNARVNRRAQRSFVVEQLTWLSSSDMLGLGSQADAAALETARSMVVPSRTGTADRVLFVCSAQDKPLSRAFAQADIASRVRTVRDFAREGLTWLDASTRADVLAFIVTSSTSLSGGGRREPRNSSAPAVDRDLRLSTALHELREALRERLPVGITDDGPIAIIDAVARLDEDAFYMRGRVAAGGSRLARVTAVSPEGDRVEVLQRAHWHDLMKTGDQPRSHVWKGFSVFFTCATSMRGAGWVVELETQAGELLEVGAPPVTSHSADVIRVVLEDLAVEGVPATALRTRQVVPAVRRLQRARRRAAVLKTVKQFGRAPNAPTVSVIVPLYRRIDLVEHQMTQFADDPTMRQVDLIYVLDSPELEDDLLGAARRLFELYRQPFRVAVVSANVGFACANNLGASIARGRLLLLLNSDVFPEAPGWLDTMSRFYDSLPNPGAVGPKLLYEDDTLQHAGMFFERLSDNQAWSNEHYFKGMHRDLPAAARSRPVPAVTGACMMVAAGLYAKLGGLSGDYVQGDFEDSEFCLRLLEAGRQNWYFANVALYHLEASSYDPERRRLHDGFNRWLHTDRWADRLSALGGAAMLEVEVEKAPLLTALVDGALARS